MKNEIFTAIGLSALFASEASASCPGASCPAYVVAFVEHTIGCANQNGLTVRPENQSQLYTTSFTNTAIPTWRLMEALNSDPGTFSRVAECIARSYEPSGSDPAFDPRVRITPINPQNPEQIPDLTNAVAAFEEMVDISGVRSFEFRFTVRASCTVTFSGIEYPESLDGVFGIRALTGTNLYRERIHPFLNNSSVRVTAGTYLFFIEARGGAGVFSVRMTARCSP